MTMRGNDVQKAAMSADDVASPAGSISRYFQTRLRFSIQPGDSVETLVTILQRLSRMDLPGTDHVAAYIRFLAYRNRRPKTLSSRFGTIILFLEMLRDSGKTRLEDITRADMESFIEHEQDRGNKITTIWTKLMGVQAFLRYLVEEEILPPTVFGRRIRLQLPERLPRAMDPDDLRDFLSVIDDTRDFAMIMVLLRTGMRIGELLDTKVADVHIKERKIEIYEAEKNRLGRVVYLSDDAISALQKWLRTRRSWEEYLFSTPRSTYGMCYSTARLIFHRYLEKAGLQGRGYTLHTLRHTFATEFLNAGMRLECLQVLLGHQSIEETRRYARLTDKTREEEYFRAMIRIEGRDGNGDIRGDRELAEVLETEKLLAQHREELSESP